MDIKNQYQRQIELVKWADEQLSREFFLTDQTRLPFNCFDLALEHHAAICALFETALYGSMYALLRVQFESCAKGMWLRHAAEQEDIEKYEKEELRIGFGTLISIVEEKLGVHNSVLSRLKSNAWHLFCSFSHTGYQALVRRSTQTHTGNVNYNEDELASYLQLSGTFTLLSAIEMASISEDERLIEDTMNKAKSYANV